MEPSPTPRRESRVPTPWEGRQDRSLAVRPREWCLRRSYDKAARTRQLLDDAEIETEVVGEQLRRV